MLVLNERAHRGRVGAHETRHAGSGLCFYPQYTAFLPRLQSAISRGLTRLALAVVEAGGVAVTRFRARWAGKLLADVGDGLAGAVLRWECGL